jgi:hypothetical protein
MPNSSTSLPESLLAQLGVEPKTDDERSRKFKLFEEYLSAVEEVRNQLLRLWAQARANPQMSTSMAAIETRVQRATDGGLAMGIEDSIPGRWFVYDMVRKAAQNNNAMAHVLQELEEALEPDSSDDEGVTPSSANIKPKSLDGPMTTSEKIEAQPSCPICLEEGAPEGDNVHFFSQCQHWVCQRCWPRWETVRKERGKRAFCPLCRREDFVCAIHGAASPLQSL